MAHINKVQATDLIDEGRKKFIENDEKMNAEIELLKNEIETHEHDDRYFTKDEFLAELSKAGTNFRKFYLQFGLEVTGSQVYGKVANINMGLNFGQVVIENSKLTKLYFVHENGARDGVEFSESLNFNKGDVLSLRSRHDVVLDSEILEIIRNGVVIKSIELPYRTGKYFITIEFEML